LQAAGARSASEESDVIVALIRTAFIIAFFCTRYLAGVADHMPRFMDGVLLLAAVFNLQVFQSHLRGRATHRQRPVALALDLVLITAAVATFSRTERFVETSRDLSGLYYLVVITAAIWFKRSGAIISALVAIALASVTPWVFGGEPLSRGIMLGTARAPLLLLVALVAGYLVRARDAEREAAVELQQEMRLARVLQSRMLPQRLPHPPGYDVGIIFQSARLVGGDFYDARLLDERRMLIVLADMAGKSVYGLVHLSLVHSHLQAAADAGLAPAAIAADVNRDTFAALQPESYAAMFVGVLDLQEHTLRFVNCGHVPPLLVPAAPGRPAEALSSGGMVIGAARQPHYAEREVQLRPGDALVCYSDGISEARNHAREEFGDERVAEAARSVLDGSAQDIADGVLAQAREFAPVERDDVTVLVVKRQPTGDALQ
jgi:serine phosphatase RsbU (regulator of sigma subunit)